MLGGVLIAAWLAGTAPTPYDVRYLCVGSVSGGSEAPRWSARSRSYPLLGEAEAAAGRRPLRDFQTGDGRTPEPTGLARWIEDLEVHTRFTFTESLATKLVSRRTYIATGAKCLNLNLTARLTGLAEPLHLYGVDCTGTDRQGRPSVDRSAAAYETEVILGHRESTLRLKVRCEKDLTYRFSFNF